MNVQNPKCAICGKEKYGHNYGGDKSHFFTLQKKCTCEYSERDWNGKYYFCGRCGGAL